MYNIFQILANEKQYMHENISHFCQMNLQTVILVGGRDVLYYSYFYLITVL